MISSISPPTGLAFIRLKPGFVKVHKKWTSWFGGKSKVWYQLILTENCTPIRMMQAADFLF